MAVRPPEAVTDLLAKVVCARAGAGFIDANARIECGIDEITDRVDDDDHRGTKQSDKASADRWAERLSGRVSLI